MISRKLLLLLSIFVYLNLLDIYTTILILQLGGKELNSFFPHFNETGVGLTDIVLKLSLVASAVFIIFLLYWRSAKENSKLGLIVTYIITIGLIGFYSLVILNNIRMLNFQIQHVMETLTNLLGGS